MRLFRPLLRNRNFMMEVEPGIWVPAELDDYVLFWCFVHGYERDPVVQLSRSLIRHGDTVVDVGANIGLWMMGAARRAGLEGEIHGFEPLEENFTRLKTNLALNGLNCHWVRCQQVALSDRCGQAIFYAPTNNNSGMGALAQREGVSQPLEVTLMTLDDYCDQQGIDRVDFMKVDVEGAELQVFRGSSRLLGAPKAPIVLFEADDAWAQSFACSTIDVKAFLNEHGYDFFRYTGRKLEPVAVSVPHTHEDLFAVKPYHFERHPILLNALYSS